MRKRLYEIIAETKGKDRLRSGYHTFMVMVIVMSLMLLAFKQWSVAFYVIDKICAGIFIMDYLFR